MRNEEFESEKMIYPNGDWRCFNCREEMRNLEVFAETENEVCLICVICYTRTARSVEFGLNDF